MTEPEERNYTSLILFVFMHQYNTGLKLWCDWTTFLVPAYMHWSGFILTEVCQMLRTVRTLLETFYRV